jgi:hypothetical protein
MLTPSNVPALLSKFGGYSSNFGSEAFPLSDHLPMTVVALAEMGATPERIETWAEWYAATNALRPADAEERGRRGLWYHRISVEGSEAVLAAVLPELAGGIGAAAFHAAIRAAYAVERDDEAELASALESWEREYLDLPGPAVTRTVELSEALRVLGRSKIHVGSHGMIYTQMLSASAQAEFHTIAELVPSSSDIDAMAIAAAVAFAQSGDFTALHVMTGTHAMRTLSSFFVDAEAAMPAFWRAYAAAALVAGTVPSLEPNTLIKLRSEAPADWEPLLAQAIAQDDEHVIKATYTAWRLDTALHDPIFRTAAKRYLDQEAST